ncbi:MAG: LysR substrate-binding domain-containing protein [Pseudomarimonas sp.]
MNLHLLRMFVAVVEHNSFSRAAAALFVSQSAVSKGVRELESQLDMVLVERSVRISDGLRGICLTEGGQALYQHGRGIFALERIASEDVRDRLQLRKGRLRLGASTTVAGYWLPPYIADFMRRYPDIEPALFVGNTKEVTGAIIDCLIDIGFVEGAVSDERLQSTVWKQEPLLLVTAANSPLANTRRPTVKQFSEQTWLIREQGSGTRQVAQRLLDGWGVATPRMVEVGSNEAIARIVASGGAIALLPEAIVGDLLSAKRLHPIEMPETAGLLRPLHRIELCNRPLPAAARAFLELTDAKP